MLQALQTRACLSCNGNSCRQRPWDGFKILRAHKITRVLLANLLDPPNLFCGRKCPDSHHLGPSYPYKFVRGQEMAPQNAIRLWSFAQSSPHQTPKNGRSRILAQQHRLALPHQLMAIRAVVHLRRVHRGM
jgi:hypothetical protein